MNCFCSYDYPDASRACDFVTDGLYHESVPVLSVHSITTQDVIVSVSAVSVNNARF